MFVNAFGTKFGVRNLIVNKYGVQENSKLYCATINDGISSQWITEEEAEAESERLYIRSLSALDVMKRIVK